MKNEFKNILKSLREEKGVGQVELARSIGVSKGIVSYWENGIAEPKMSALIKLSVFFGVSIDYLVGIEDC